MDIVERLRLRIHTSEDETALTDEAADKIERLREALRDVIPYIDTCNSEHRDAQERAKNALKEKE